MDPAQIEPIALLQDPVRRRLYEFVASAPSDVGRNEAAEAVAVSRTLAAFHLDKLVEAGLLTASYRRPEGRGGPGAGRPAKYYRPSPGEFAVSAPPRAYRDLAGLLAETVARAGLDDEAAALARAAGRAAAVPPPAGPEADAFLAALGERGYVPVERDGEVLLRNCPFHALAEAFPPLVCAMNLALLEGMTEGTGWRARMAAEPGRCCVALSKNNDL